MLLHELFALLDPPSQLSNFVFQRPDALTTDVVREGRMVAAFSELDTILRSDLSTAKFAAWTAHLTT
jgi:hypothetical protein